MPPHDRAGRHLVGAVLAGDLDPRPLAPQVDAGRGLDDVDDEGAADAGRGLEEVPRAVVRADELGVRHAAQQSERLHHAGIQLRERDRVGIVGAQRPRDEDAGVVRDDERRRLVPAGARETHFAVEHDRVDVEDVARDELLEQEIGLAVAERVERAPQFVGRVQAA